MSESDIDESGLVGQTVAGKFAIEGVIGVGGMGTVYRARQLALDRVVALKILHQDMARDGRFVERFKQEARAASRLDHPNSVRVLDFGQDGADVLFIAMEYVEGHTLLDLLRQDWPLDDQRIVSLVSQILAGLAVAHDLGIIHRDLKPENIMVVRVASDDDVTSEIAKVCDFGIAQLVTMASVTGTGQQDVPRFTTGGLLIATPGYMSPEQARGQSLDGRSDLYSVGVLLYQILTRRLPFESETPFGLALKHVTDPPPPPSMFARVNPALEGVCLKALNKAPEDRYPSARAMRAALRTCVGPAVSISASYPTKVYGATPDTLAATVDSNPTWRGARLRRRRWALAAAGTGLAVLAGAVAVWKVALPDHPPAVPELVASGASADPAAGPKVTPPASESPLPAPAPAPAPEPAPPPEPAPEPSAGGWDVETPGTVAGGPSRKRGVARPGRASRALDRAQRGRPLASATKGPPESSARAPAGSATAVDRPAAGTALGSTVEMPRLAARAPNAGGAAAAGGGAAAAAAPGVAGGGAAGGGAPGTGAPAPTPAAAAAPAPAAGSPATIPPAAALTRPPASRPTAITPPPPLRPAAPGPANPDQATVTIAAITTSSGILGSSIRSALRRAPFQRCYRDAVRAHGSGGGNFSGTLALQVGVTGHVRSATVQGTERLPGLKGCLEEAARGTRVRDVDTGDVTAVVNLDFVIRP